MKNARNVLNSGVIGLAIQTWNIRAYRSQRPGPWGSRWPCSPSSLALAGSGCRAGQPRTRWGAQGPGCLPGEALQGSAVESLPGPSRRGRLWPPPPAALPLGCGGAEDEVGRLACPVGSPSGFSPTRQVPRNAPSTWLFQIVRSVWKEKPFLGWVRVETHNLEWKFPFLSLSGGHFDCLYKKYVFSW